MQNAMVALSLSSSQIAVLVLHLRALLGVAVDFSACSIKALKLTVDNVVREGDNLVLIIVRHAHGYEHMQLWETTGSPLIPLAEFSDPVLMKRYELKPAPEVIDIVSTAATQKKIKKVIMESVSNYVVNNASCPITVVKNPCHHHH
ncbi:hypothetical protein D0Y65_023081 [Glycine soja]|uniref:Uncharacterized protein n=1 Tax=Glycine soja TaxID=3848 RepID=A0A445IWD3_GLYSO|nr:hypothetical protein D0Y65_023081 [Glycine soja]